MLPGPGGMVGRESHTEEEQGQGLTGRFGDGDPDL